MKKLGLFLLNAFLFPGDIVCDLSGVPQHSSHRQILRSYINIIVWGARGKWWRNLDVCLIGDCSGNRMIAQKLTSDLSVAWQLNPGDFAHVGKLSFKSVMSNRPDREGAKIAKEAHRSGLEYHNIPVVSDESTYEETAAFLAVIRRLIQADASMSSNWHPRHGVIGAAVSGEKPHG